jgi:hypothetical protein
MTPIDGEWDCVVDLPMGRSKALVTFKSDDDQRFTGTYVGALGNVAISNGQLAGQTVTFKMKFTSPLPIGIKVEALVSGDIIEGIAKAGIFGGFAIKATRKT